MFSLPLAFLYFQASAPHVLVLLLAINPILTLTRAVTVGTLAMLITVILSKKSSSKNITHSDDISLDLLDQSSEASVCKGE